MSTTFSPFRANLARISASSDSGRIGSQREAAPTITTLLARGEPAVFASRSDSIRWPSGSARTRRYTPSSGG